LLLAGTSMDEHRKAAGEPQEALEGPQEAAAFDPVYARALAVFVLRAPRRRPVLTALLFVAFGATALLLAQSISPAYRAELRLIAQPGDADESRVAEAVKYGIEVARSRDVLARVVDQADLAGRSERARPWTLRVRDRMFGWLGHRGSGVDARLAAIGLLRTRLAVEEERTGVTIAVTWPDPQGAYDAVNLERELFLGAVYDALMKVAVDRQELADVGSQKTYSELLDALRAYTDLSSRSKPSSVRGASAVAAAPVAPSHLSEEVAEKERQVRQDEASWRAALDRRNEELAEALRKYTRNHPVVIELEREVDAMSHPPEGLVEAREDLRLLRGELEAEVGASARPPQPSAPSAPADDRAADDSGSLLVRSALDAAMRNHIAADEAAAKEDALVDVTRRRARDRFRVGTPAEVPGTPVRPAALIATIASLPAGALIALILASLFDIWRGQVLESWQVRRRLKIEPLAELDL